MPARLLAAFISVCALTAQPNPDTGSIAGRVSNLFTGEPVPKALVELTATRSRSIRLVAETDAEGKFQFFGLPPGTYKLSASHSRFLARPARRPIPLGPNEHLTDAGIRLPPHSVISGHVRDKDGEPVDRARVLIFKQVYRNGRRVWDRLNTVANTDDTGEYRFPGLRPGPYLLQATSTRPELNNRYGDPPNSSYVPTYHQSTASRHEALPVEVGLGAEVRGADIHLVRLARPASVRIRGRVTGVPPGGQVAISVGVTPIDDMFFGGANTVAIPPDYTFELRTRPGQYSIHANVYSGGAPAYASGTLNVTGDLTGVEVVMSPAPVVAGRFTLAESGPPVKLQGVRFDLRRHDSSSVHVGRSDAAGKFALEGDFQPGHYEIVVKAYSLPENCFVQKLKLDGQEVSPDDFEISTSGQLEFVLSSTAGAITGSVSDAEDKPFPVSSVTAIPVDGKSLPVKQAVDDDGNFKITNLRPGKYKLFAWEDVDDDVWQDPEFLGKYEALATVVAVGPRESQTAQLRAIPAEAMR